jgi:Xaa-Pro aminopeptidase
MPVEMIHRRRRALWDRPELEGIEIVVLSCPAHLHYFCGFTGSSGLLLLTREGTARFVTDGRYDQQSREQVEDADIIITRDPPIEALRSDLPPRGRAGWEARHLTVEQAGLDEALQGLRLIKDNHELEVLTRAAAIADGVMAQMTAGLAPGMTELEVAGAIEASLRRHGSQGSAFEAIVVSGVRGALPHGRPSRKRLEAGELVTLDFGAVVEGYHSDLTRTLSLGIPTPEQQQWLETISAALEAALALVEPGRPVCEVDAAARTVIDAAGFGAYFVHNLGHGIGLDVHEAPRLSPSSSEVIAAGMVFTLEPGIYLPGRGGVRIEEDVAVTPDGIRVLTGSPHRGVVHMGSRRMYPSRAGGNNTDGFDG